MSTYGRLVLVALCLTWTCAIRVIAQASNPSAGPIGSEPGKVAPPVGDPASGDKPADGEAGPAADSTASQPAPFGGPWNSRPKLTGDWFGLREHLRANGLTLDISSTAYYQG